MNDTNQVLNNNAWMTQIYEHIKNLRVHQLALPSSHNAGVDRGAVEVIGGHWAACQDYIFETQLRQGARVLDLRIIDNSYKKDIGGSKIPRYRFIEEFKCQHVLPGRNIDNCLSAVRTFAEQNRGELIILDIHSYDSGRNLNNSIARFRQKLSQLNHLLIPPTASSLTLAEIRKSHPNRNVIICWGGGAYWNTIKHIWTGKNLTSRAELETFITNQARKSVSATALTSLSATVYDALGGPVRLKSGEKVWSEVFHPQHSIFNIINADFFQDTGVVQRCIALNKARAMGN
ncbi:hypothetical protein [Pseudomonas sp. GM55]|jgi:hypothetical protein|uniref:hypothetical protein n=1 Tax=Pseudomonas sp. GM55 TaxID=1144333 RepID=UPI000270AEB9|nr:hypothetical protein [Pseudomonas sp. GM55]EJM76553.1 hypothetical protein PMI31_01417 [Pseudomonas sp. GM55]